MDDLKERLPASERAVGTLNGVSVGSPKATFRAALRAGLLDAEEVEAALVMTDDRNLTAHTYVEAVAVAIFEKLSKHRELLASIVTRIRGRVG